MMKKVKWLAKGIITGIFAIFNVLALKFKIIPIIGTANFFPAANAFGPSIGGIIGPMFGPLAVIISILLKLLLLHSMSINVSKQKIFNYLYGNKI